jgi:hypothetical protein
LLQSTGQDIHWVQFSIEKRRVSTAAPYHPNSQ